LVQVIIPLHRQRLAHQASVSPRLADRIDLCRRKELAPISLPIESQEQTHRCQNTNQRGEAFYGATMNAKKKTQTAYQVAKNANVAINSLK
jgi:hypothetical protein